MAWLARDEIHVSVWRDNSTLLPPGVKRHAARATVNRDRTWGAASGEGPAWRTPDEGAGASSACAVLGLDLRSEFLDARDPCAQKNIARRATLAESSHSTQPWRLRRTASIVNLLVDGIHALPVNDPFNRAPVIRCGAACVAPRAAWVASGQGAWLLCCQTVRSGTTRAGPLHASSTQG